VSVVEAAMCTVFRYQLPAESVSDRPAALSQPATQSTYYSNQSTIQLTTYNSNKENARRSIQAKGIGETNGKRQVSAVSILPFLKLCDAAALIFVSWT